MRLRPDMPLAPTLSAATGHFFMTDVRTAPRCPGPRHSSRSRADLRRPDRGAAPLAAALRVGPAERALLACDANAARRRYRRDDRNCNRGGADRVAWAARSRAAQSPSSLAAASCLAAVGMVDDLRPIPVVPRLALQFAVDHALVRNPSAAGPDFRGRSRFRWSAGLLILGLLWFVNLVNFMDGLDWMTVAEMLPITTALAAFALFGEAPSDMLPIALGARRRPARLRSFQPARRTIIPGRCRQPADRPSDRLVPDRTGIASAFRRGAAAAALLSRRRNDHTVQAGGGRRADFGTPIDRIFISAPPTMDLASGGSSPKYSCSTWSWRDWRRYRSPPVRRASIGDAGAWSPRRYDRACSIFAGAD